MKIKYRFSGAGLHIIIALLTSLAFVALLLPQAQASVDTDELAVIQKTSKAFTQIAKKTIPTVVFIKVEKTIEAGQQLSPNEFNNPFDLYSDEFF